MESVECIVIGAGVVGLALARALADQGREVIILEAEDRIGTGISSRNSEVIHAGMYYPEGSLMARLCVQGHERLRAYCQSRNVRHQVCGKLIVATSNDQSDKLAAIHQRGKANGIKELHFLEAHEAVAMEPALHCTAALYSPTTGTIDSHGLMTALLQDAESDGAILVLRSPFLGGTPIADGIRVSVGGDEPFAVVARHVFNCAGLSAQAVASSVTGRDRAGIPPIHYAKGNYFTLAGRAPFSRLIYPVPEIGGLGVHLTLDLGGQARFGPDVEWVDAPDYRVDPGRCTQFCDRIRTYWPALPDDALAPGYAGIRPKLQGPGQPWQDFQIQTARTHGIRGWVDLFGIESPGLTACLALADWIAASVNGTFGDQTR